MIMFENSQNIYDLNELKITKFKSKYIVIDLISYIDNI